MHFTVHPCAATDLADWATLRHALWPSGSVQEHQLDACRQLTHPQQYAQFIARAAESPIGLVEASIRHDYVNGASASPVAFLEGLYVDPAARQSGVAAQLVASVEAWARSKGCAELASDTGLDNLASQHVHRALGFQETERVVFFCKRLGRAAEDSGGPRD